jgi:Flp pilus assembly protein TadG
VNTPFAPRMKGERASAAVEFALVLPLILTLALALLQIGIFVKDQLVVEEAARAGARQAAVSTDDSSTRQAAVDAAVSLDPDRLDITVERDDQAGGPVTVKAAYRAPVSVPIVGWLFPSEVDLSATTVMRQETG